MIGLLAHEVFSTSLCSWNKVHTCQHGSQGSAEPDPVCLSASLTSSSATLRWLQFYPFPSLHTFAQKTSFTMLFVSILQVHVCVFSPQQGTAATYIPRLTSFLHAECSHLLKLRDNRPITFQVSNIMIWDLHRLQNNFYLKYYFGEVTPLLRKSRWLPVSWIKSRICLVPRPLQSSFVLPIHLTSIIYRQQESSFYIRTLFHWN